MKVYDEKAEKEILARLNNWALWSSIGGFPNLDPPAYVEVMSEYFPSEHRSTPYDKDAEHLEHIISTLDIAGRNGQGWGDIYRFILKQEFLEHERPQILKAQNVKRWLRVESYTQRTYRNHWYAAKKAVFMYADPI